MLELKLALLRFVRVMVAQAFTYWVAQLAGVNIPMLNISAGAVLNAVAKVLRDKYKWEWLPI